MKLGFMRCLPVRCNVGVEQRGDYPKWDHDWSEEQGICEEGVDEKGECSSKKTK